ncbi:MAG: ABC transporter substrate-binding protein [Burkholderiales bacterium]
MKKFVVLSGLLAALMFSPAHADIKIGITLSATGPAASLGIPEKNTVEFYPATIAGQKMEYIVLDDASDTAKAVANTKKFVSEDKVDIIVGSSITPNSLAMVDIAAEAKTPMISMANSARIVEPQDEKRRWAFKVPQGDSLMADAIAKHMATTGIKTIGIIGYADPYGEGWLKEMKRATEANGVKIIGEEKFNRTDTSVTAQILKLVSLNPDAILVAGSGTPAALPHTTLVERSYKGKIYQTHGAANNDFLRVGGKALEKGLLPVGPLLVAEQLDDNHPAKKTALEYIKVYEGKHGAGSRSGFGGHAWDAMLILQKAIPEALKKAQPGTAEFRAALRDAIEGVKGLPAAHGVFNFSATDHAGLADDARVMVTVENGTWKLIK